MSSIIEPWHCTVINQWDKDKVVFTGTKQQCYNYIDKYNVYGYNYSKLRYKENKNEQQKL